MQRRQFLKSGIATSALLGLPAAAAASALATPARFALGYHGTQPGARWMPASERPHAAPAPRLRIALRGMQPAHGESALQRASVELLYRAPGTPSYFYASMRSGGRVAASQPVRLELDADRLAGLRVDYTWRGADGTLAEHSQTLAWTGFTQPLLTPGSYALLGARPDGALPRWDSLAAPAGGCALGRCDGGNIDFDALIIEVEAA